MKLIDLLTAMGKDNINPKVSITVFDNDNTALITYKSGGYAYVESDLSNKKVKKVKITSAQLVDVYIDDDEENTNNSDPGTDPGTDPSTDPSNDPSTDPTGDP